MQNPTVKAEASIPTENVSDDEPDWNRKVKVRRKAAKRLPFELSEEELDLVSQDGDEDTPARKKPRLEEPIPTTTDKAARKVDSPDVSEGLPPPNADNDDANANADPVTDTKPNAGATGRWTLEEDAKLTLAVSNTSKKKWRKEYTSDWAAITALIPGRTERQCRRRWHNGLDPSIDRASERKGCRWTAAEDSQLKDAVQTHGDKDWVAVSAKVPGQTRRQCQQRWQLVLDPSIALTGGSKGEWTTVEDSKLKDAVKTHGDKEWGAISLMVPG
jgi:hypothetical protein